MNLQNLSEDEQYLLARVSDAVKAADTRGRVKMIGFLDERQQAIAAAALARWPGVQSLFYGGHTDATRKVLGVFPSFTDLDVTEGELFPEIAAVTAEYRAQDALSHRDFLGALMNLGIKRETVGDILVGEGYSVIFALSHTATILADELVKVGRVGVRCQLGVPEQLPDAQRFSEIRDTVSSMRLDCVVAVLVRCSREKAAQLIRQGVVTHNYVCADQVSKTVEPGDKLSIRGHGKFLVAQQNGRTKKGRISLTCKKYL